MLRRDIALRAIAIGLMLTGTACSAGDEPEAPSAEDLANQTHIPSLPKPGAEVDGFVWEPIDVTSSRAARAGFSWSSTVELSEVSTFSYPADGTGTALPPIRYAQIYVKNADQLRELEEMGIHYSTTPLFDSEWPSANSVVTIPAGGDDQDGGAMFVFGLIPTPVYNAIRAEALAGEATYDALILRDLPSEVASADGTVNWNYLLDNMEVWAPITGELTDDGEVIPPVEDAEESEQKRLGRRLRRAIRKVAGAVRAVVDGIRQVVAAHANLFLKSKTITIATKVNDRTKAPLVRAWDDGANGFGKRLQLNGLRVNVTGMSRLTLYKAKLDENGVAQVKVPQAIRVNVCFEADSPSAKFEAGVLVPVLHCWLKQDPEKDFGGTARAVGDTEFYDMAQVIDAREYASSVLGFRPPKVTIQVGWLGEVLGSTTSAYTPCLAAPRAPVSMANAYADALNAAGALAGTTVLGAPIPVGMIVEFMASTDIVLAKAARASRNTIVHEYGHFFFCSLLAATNRETYNLVWSQVITPKNLDAASATPVKALNEGIADWFVSQVTGSTNYVWPVSASSEVGGGNLFMDSAGPGAGEGLEMNYGGPACSGPGCDTESPALPPTQQVVSKVASILHDALDRGDCGADAACRAERRSDAAPWNTSTGGVFATETAFTLTHIADEEIALSPLDIKESMVEFANQNTVAAALTYENFYSALSGKMRQRKYTDSQICTLFALHETDGNCAFGNAQALPPAAPPIQTFTVTATATDGGGVTPPSTVVNSGDGVTLLATAAPGFRFAGYTGSPQCTGSDPQLVISGVTSDVSCTANFIRQVTLSFVNEGVTALSITGTVGPSGAACVGQACTTDLGGSVSLFAKVRNDHWVDRWTCTEANTGIVLDTFHDVDPAVLNLGNLQNNWTCEVLVYQMIQ